MRRSLIKYIFLILCSSIVYSQHLSVYDVNTDNYPIISAKFFAYDEDYLLLNNLTTSDLTVIEAGIEKEVLNIIPASISSSEPLSTIFAVDFSSSVNSDDLENINSGITAWVKAQTHDNSESALVFYNNYSYIWQDYTNDNNKIINDFSFLPTFGGRNIDNLFLNSLTGIFAVSDSGKYQKNIVLFSSGKPDFVPDINEIVSQAISKNVKVYIVYMDAECPAELRQIAEQTGGQYFESISAKQDIENTCLRILQIINGIQPCEIVWETSGCELERTADIEISKFSLNNSVPYIINESQLPEILISFSNSISFGAIAPGVIIDTVITITAINGDVEIDSISSNNVDFYISDFGGESPTFIINENESRNISIEFSPSDSSLSFAKFKVFGSVCTGNMFYASGGFPSVPIKYPTLKLLNPDGGEYFKSGGETTIKWHGILPNDSVMIEYSLNNGNDWQTIIERTAGLSYDWENIPDTISNECLMKIHLNRDKYTVLDGHTYRVNSVSWSPNGSLLASGSDDGTIRVWDVANGKCIDTLLGHTGFVNSVDWSSDGTKIVSASSDSTIRIWDYASGACLDTLTEHTQEVLKVKWSPNSATFASCSADSTVKLWNSNTGSSFNTFKGHDGVPNDISWKPDGLQLASAGDDGRIVIWNTENGFRGDTILRNSSDIKVIEWSNDGTRIAGAGEVIKIWDASTGGLIISLVKKHATPVLTFSWNSDDTRIVSSAGDNLLFIYDVSTGDMIEELGRIGSDGLSVSYDPQGNSIASGSRTIRIWYPNGVFFQEDISDGLWSIVLPELQSKNIDFADVLVENVKDIVAVDFIKNSGYLPIKIDTFYLQGNDAVQFEILTSSSSFTLDPDEKHDAIFRFKPSSKGIKNAEIVIISSDSTLIQSISGEGIEPVLETSGEIIDFGKVFLGIVKDTVSVMLRNISDSDVSIISTELIGSSFSIDSGGGSFILSPNEDRKLKVSYFPLDLERNSAYIAFHYNGTGSPELTTLYGESVQMAAPSVGLEIDTIVAYSGDAFTINIYLRSPVNLGYSTVSAMKVDLSFNSTLLYPVDFPNAPIDNNIRTLSLTLPNTVEDDSVLTSLRFISALGNNDNTELTLSNFEAIDGNLEFKLNNGLFILKGVCEKGGKRLLYSSGQIKLMNVRPNPASESVKLEYELIETGKTKLFITNIFGETERIIFYNEPKIGRHTETINISDLSSGIYFLILQTPTEIKTRKFQIVR